MKIRGVENEEKKFSAYFPEIAFPDDKKKNDSVPINPEKKEDEEKKKEVNPPIPTDPNNSIKKQSDLNHISFIGWVFITFLLLIILSIAVVILYKVRQLKKVQNPGSDLNETIDLSYQTSHRTSSFLNDTQLVK